MLLPRGRRRWRWPRMGREKRLGEGGSGGFEGFAARGRRRNSNIKSSAARAKKWSISMIMCEVWL